jgi:hypothetical protein
MEQQTPPWRIRIRTVMLLIAITALASYIIVERWHGQQEAQQRLAAMQRAAAEAEQARVQAQQVRAFLEAGTESQSPTGEFPTRSTAGEPQGERRR